MEAGHGGRGKPFLVHARPALVPVEAKVAGALHAAVEPQTRSLPAVLRVPRRIVESVSPANARQLFLLHVRLVRKLAKP